VGLFLVLPGSPYLSLPFKSDKGLPFTSDKYVVYLIPHGSD